MKKFISPLILLFILSCSKDRLAFNSEPLEQRDSEKKITICHQNGQGEFHPISISENALPAHENHMDYNPDVDGDGHTALGACTGDGQDCNDLNPDVWQDCGCGQITSGFLDSFGIIAFAFTDACNIIGVQVPGILLLNENFEVIFLGQIDDVSRLIISTEEFFCDAIVNVDITAQQFSAYLNTMIGYIENHDLIDFCVGGLPYKKITLLKYDGIKKITNNSILSGNRNINFEDLVNRSVRRSER